MSEKTGLVRFRRPDPQSPYYRDVQVKVGREWVTVVCMEMDDHKRVGAVLERFAASLLGVGDE